MLLFYVQVLNQVPAESQRSKGDAVVRQSYLGFLEATLALVGCLFYLRSNGVRICCWKYY